jgi:hypothetical protein
MEQLHPRKRKKVAPDPSERFADIEAGDREATTVESSEAILSSVSASETEGEGCIVIPQF